MDDTKNKIESLIDKVIKSISINDSPMTNWLDLNDAQKSELTFFHFTYGWLFILENKLVTQGDEYSLSYYFYSCYNELSKYTDTITKESFTELFFDRFKEHRNELSLVRKNNNNSELFFPKYFYTKLMHETLRLDTTNKIINYSYSDFELHEDELSDIYAHQVNFIQKNLKLNLK